MSQWNFNFITPQHLNSTWYQKESWVNEVLRKQTEHITGVRNVNTGSELKKIQIGNCEQEKMLRRLLESGKPFVFQKARQFGMSNIVNIYLTQWKKSKTKA